MMPKQILLSFFLLLILFLSVTQSVSALTPGAKKIPQIDISAQDTCSYKTKSKVVIKKITNLESNQKYTWWWEDVFLNPTQGETTTGVVDSNSSFSIIIPADKTTGTAIAHFCIDIEGQRRVWSDQQGNCIALDFTGKGPPACGSGSVNNPSSAPTPPAGTATTAPTTAPTGSGGSGAAASTPAPTCTAEQIPTAIGCIRTKPAEFIQDVSKLLTGLGGGVALLMMIAGAFRMITSAGNPDAIKAGSEQFSSAIIGLLFIIFAVLLLKVIGVDILNIPGFV